MRSFVCRSLWVIGAIAWVGCSSGAYPYRFTEGYDVLIPASSFRPVGNTYVVPGSDHLLYFSQGSAVAVFTAAQAGGYEAHVVCAGTMGGREFPRFKVSLDGHPVGAETTLTTLDPTKYVFEVELPSGEHRFGVEYTNDFLLKDERDDVVEDRNFVLIGVGLRKVR